MKRLRIAFCVCAFGLAGCAQYREQVPPSLQADLEAKYGSPLALTPVVEYELERWNGEDVVAIAYEGDKLYVVSAELGSQVFGKVAESLGKSGAEVANPYQMPLILLAGGSVGLSALGGFLAGRKKRKAALESELASQPPPGPVVIPSTEATPVSERPNE